MPSRIPYDPSLVLGNIVPLDKLAVLEQIGEIQAEVDAAEDELNANIEMKRNLDMTMQQLINMNVPTNKLESALNDVGKAIAESAEKFAEVRLQAEPEIARLQSQMGKISVSPESPIDYNRSLIKTMPLASDSLTFDAKYFSFDENRQSAQNTITAIKEFVSYSTRFLGRKRSAEMTSSAQAQVSSQVSTHSLSGTLVITANCTHKDALLLAPFVVDVDKAIRVWNELFPDKPIRARDPQNVYEIAREEGARDEERLQVLSGATYGSSFVGMVHVLRDQSDRASQTMLATAQSLQAQMEAGGWFAKASGGLGVAAQFANDVKRMLSTQQISSHASLVTTGSIPTIKSNEVRLAVKEFAEFDPADMMQKLATLENATTSDQSSVQESAKAARTGSEMLQIRGSEVQSVMSALGEIDDGKDKMLDINSLMTAFEDYVEKALAGRLGVPIDYFLKPITRSQLAQMWVAKYYPGYFRTASGDDRDVVDKQEGGAAGGGDDQGNADL